MIALWNRHNICNAIAHVWRQRNANILLTRYLKVNWGVNYKILINKHTMQLIALVHYYGRKILSSNVTKYLKTMIIKRVNDDVKQICGQMIKLHVYIDKIVILFYCVWLIYLFLLTKNILSHLFVLLCYDTYIVDCS